MVETCTSHGWWGYGIPCSPLLSLPSVGASGAKGRPAESIPCLHANGGLHGCPHPERAIRRGLDGSLHIRQIHPYACLHPEHVRRWIPCGSMIRRRSADSRNLRSDGYRRKALRSDTTTRPACGLWS